MREDQLKMKRWLRALREDSGLSQAALAEVVGVERETIAHAESENENYPGLPRGFTLLRILQELGALADAPVPADRPLARLEEKVDEAVAGIADILALLTRGEGGADARGESP